MGRHEASCLPPSSSRLARAQLVSLRNLDGRHERLALFPALESNVHHFGPGVTRQRERQRRVLSVEPIVEPLLGLAVRAREAVRDCVEIRWTNLIANDVAEDAKQRLEVRREDPVFELDLKHRQRPPKNCCTFFRYSSNGSI